MPEVGPGGSISGELLPQSRARAAAIRAEVILGSISGHRYAKLKLFAFPHIEAICLRLALYSTSNHRNAPDDMLGSLMIVRSIPG